MRVEPGNGEDRRGDAEIPAQRGGGHPPGMYDGRRAEAFDRPAQGQMDRDRDDAQRRRDQHHDRVLDRSGEFGQVLGMARMAKARAIEAVLVDRVGDERGGTAAADIGDGGVDGADNGRHIGRIGMRRPGARRDADRDNRKRLGKCVKRPLGSLDRPDRHRPAEPAGQGNEAPGIVDQVKRRHALTTGEPRHQRDLAADPGGFTHRHGKRQRHRPHTLTSTKAARRRSRR